MMQQDYGTHIVKPFRKNGKLPVAALKDLFMFARPRRKSPGHRKVSGTGQTRRIVWHEFWIAHEAAIYRMLTKRVPHHQIADRLGITRIPLENYLRRMRAIDPVKYRQRNISDHKEIIDRMLEKRATQRAIAKAIGYSERSLHTYLKTR
jgi:predicted transcriptional regulator